MKTVKIRDTKILNEGLIKKPMYFYDDFEECVVRTKPNKESDVEYWIKYKGNIEFKGTTHNSNIYEIVHLYSLSITKKDYDKY